LDCEPSNRSSTTFPSRLSATGYSDIAAAVRGLKKNLPK
jgi:hypothetical protein